MAASSLKVMWKGAPLSPGRVSESDEWVIWTMGHILSSKYLLNYEDGTRTVKCCHKKRPWFFWQVHYQGGA